VREREKDRSIEKPMSCLSDMNREPDFPEERESESEKREKEKRVIYMFI